MKAITYMKYGDPEKVLNLREVKKPSPRDDEVLVRTIAASVNFNDAAYVRGKPFLSRLWTGLIKPKHQILGTDISGRIEEVGINVTRFQVGDEVFAEIGDVGCGAFAEYVTVPEKLLVQKPVNLSFEEAAAVPQAATTALQGLRNKVQIQPKQEVLINGASGGIGTFAVQIAKYFEAVVTGVCSTKNANLLYSIGADHVIDYTSEDFTQNAKQYDLILDIVANRRTSDYLAALKPHGVYVAVAFNPSTLFFGSMLSNTKGKKASSLMAKTNVEDLTFLKKLLETGKMKPVIDRHFPLSNVAEAIRYYEQGAQGKIIIKVGDDA